jgi:hypothetical protein
LSPVPEPELDFEPFELPESLDELDELDELDDFAVSELLDELSVEEPFDPLAAVSLPAGTVFDPERLSVR